MPRSGLSTIPVSVLGLLALGACVSAPKWQPRNPQVTTQVFDAAGRPMAADAQAANYQVLGLGPPRKDPLREIDQAAQDPELSPQEAQRRREAQIRNTFGSTVLIRGELITKRYFMSGESGRVFQKLVLETPAPKAPAAPIKALRIGGKADQKSILGQMLGDNEVQISYFPDFEQVELVGSGIIQGYNPKTKMMAPKKVGLAENNALLLVTAKATELAAFENTLNLFYSNIPQVEIEVKVVEFSVSDSLSFGIGASNTPTFNNLSSSKLVSSVASSFALNPPVGSGLKDKGVFTLGGIHDGWELNAALEVLEATGRADVLSSPRLVVRNGGTAAIATFTEYPFPRGKITSNNVTETNVEFKPVGVSLGIKPIIAGTDTVILQLQADVSAVTGFASTEPIDTPIVSTRSAITSVHVPNRKTTVIGGLLFRNRLENETKVPILGDIPVLGYLFRSTTTQSSETNLSFFITPTIREGSADVLAR